MTRHLLGAALVLAVSVPAVAQERPYFVTYDHSLAEPGGVEVAVATTTGFPRARNPAYAAPWLEIEVGVTRWWTTELGLESVFAGRDGSAVTGWRWESRFRPVKTEHRVNPLLYVEYEQINEASRIQKEVVGAGPLAFGSIAALQRSRAHELEAKLILSSVSGGWNLSENLIVEKNLSHDEGVEFGYSLGVSRSLGGPAPPSGCRFCRENVSVGVEAYGGLGCTRESALSATRHFIAPAISWRLTDRSHVKASLGFGLTRASDGALLRLGWAYEF